MMMRVQNLPVTFTSNHAPIAAVVNSVGASTGTPGTTCAGTALASVTIKIPRVPRMPDLTGKKLCVALQHPASADGELKLALSQLPVPPSAEKFHVIDQLELNALRQREAIKESNLLKVISALAKEFGFVGYENTERLAKRASTDPLFIGLAGKHAPTMLTIETTERLSLEEEGDFPILQEFVNALHQLVQRKKLRDYLPAEMRFWVMFEGAGNTDLVFPTRINEEIIATHKARHPEASKLVDAGELRRVGIANFNILLDSKIGAIGSESFDGERLERVMRDTVGQSSTGGTRVSKNVKDFCDWAIKKLHGEQCNQPIMQRDLTLVQDATKLMHDMYGNKLKTGGIHPIVFVLRGEEHFMELPGLFDKSKPDCQLGAEMHEILKASPGKKPQPPNSLQALVQKSCAPFV
jgi:hypothetical protein